MIKAVIFDLDGVIFDSEVLHKKAWEKVFGNYHIIVEQKYYLEGIGISDVDFLKKLKNEKKIPENFGIEQLISEKREKLLEISENGAKILPGMDKFIKQLHQHYILAVASNSDKRFINNLLKKAGLTEYFSVILGFQDISQPKPSPEIYLKCSEKLNIPTFFCAVIEDSPAGIKAAKAAGMKCIAIASMLPEHFLSEADLIIKNIDFLTVKHFLTKKN